MAAKSSKRSSASRAARVAPPPPPPPKPLTLEERTATLESRLQGTDVDFQRHYKENLDMSWIYHDSALEGVVYSFSELKTAVDSSATVVHGMHPIEG